MKHIDADIVSGFSSTIFGISYAPDIVAIGNGLVRYRFPFHGITIDPVKHHGVEWIQRAEYRAFSDRLIASLSPRTLDYIGSVSAQVTREADQLQAHAATLLPTLTSLPTPQVLTAYRTFMDEYLVAFGRGCFVFLYEETVSERLAESLQRRYTDIGSVLESILVSGYRSYMTESATLLHRIHHTRGITQRRLINRYMTHYFYAHASYAGAPILTASTVRTQARHHATKLSPKPARRIRLTARERNIVALLKRTEPIRDQRKRICQIGLYVMFRFLDEAIRRTGIPRQRAERIFWYEYPKLFTQSSSFRRQLSARTSATIVFDHGTRIHRAGVLLRQRESESHSQELRGTPASSGKITGVVRIVRAATDFRAFKKGEILVTEMTRPEFVPVMRRAAAIITDEGGLTCHAAIISRELGIPCIVGTRFATRTLKNGDRVKIDAHSGTITKI